MICVNLRVFPNGLGAEAQRTQGIAEVLASSFKQNSAAEYAEEAPWEKVWQMPNLFVTSANSAPFV